MTNAEMTLNEFLGTLEESDDLYFYKRNNCYNVTINDYEGLDKNYNEIIRDIINYRMMEAFVKWLDKEAIHHDDESLYEEYQFDGFSVIIGYASYDI